MPVYKYKSFSEAERALWHFQPGDDYLKAIKKLWEFADQLSRMDYPRGVFKFKSLKEANEHRQAVELNHAKALRLKRLDRSKMDSD